MTYAARRIMWGKCLNSGQVCIAPDYMLCTRDTAESFVVAAKRVLLEYFGEDPRKSPAYGRIINAGHFKYVKSPCSIRMNENYYQTSPFFLLLNIFSQREPQNTDASFYYHLVACSRSPAFKEFEQISSVF
jgi:hypothetical protein